MSNGIMVLSKFKHISRMAIGILSSGCQGLDGKTSEATSDAWESGPTSPDITTNDDIYLGLGDAYEKIETIKHATSFERSKDIFSCRHLVPEDNGVVFEPVMSVIDDCSIAMQRNVNFILRSLNGPCGIWQSKSQYTCSSDHPIDNDKPKYYQLPGPAIDTTAGLQTEILVTKQTRSDLEVYDPLSTSGPWRVIWDQEANSYLHYIKRRQSKNNNTPIPSVKFILDESIFGTTEEERIAFSENIFVSYSESPDMGRSISGQVDNHVIAGPLRLILASTCLRWPGGIVLHPTGGFNPDRTILRYEAFHATMSREVLIQYETEQDIPTLNQDSLYFVQDFLNALGSATFAEVRDIFIEQPELVSLVRAVFLQLSSQIDTNEAYVTLRKAMHAFIQFTASNCLDFEVTKTTSTPEVSSIQNFEELYRFVLSILPDRRCHQVFRNCIVKRIAAAVDSK